MHEVYRKGISHQDSSRKRVRSHTCIENSIESYRKGDQEEALRLDSGRTMP